MMTDVEMTRLRAIFNENAVRGRFFANHPLEPSEILARDLTQQIDFLVHLINESAHKSAEADARLIAAAPDMLKALYDARWVISSWGGNWTGSLIQKTIDNAITKAEGPVV